MAKLTYTGAEVQTLLEKVDNYPDNLDPASITEAIKIDDNTIKRTEDGVLYATGSGGGGTGSSGDIPATLPNPHSLTITQGSNTVTYDGSEPKSITLESGGSGGGGVSYALSWSGYSSGSYDGSEPKTITIPTRLPASDVSSWAKKSTKPTYTASEVGALSEDGGTIDGDLAITGDLAIAGHIASLSTSDERLKKNIRKFSATGILESMGGVYEYEYTAEEVEKNPHNAGTHRGFIYQNVAKSQMANMAIECEDGYGAVNYLHPDYLALLAAVNLELIKRVETLEKLLNEKSV